MAGKQVLLALLLAVGAAAARQLRQTPGTTYYELRVTTAVAAPDCYQKNVVLVNGQFQPSLEVKQGDTLVVRGCRLDASALQCCSATRARAWRSASPGSWQSPSALISRPPPPLPSSAQVNVFNDLPADYPTTSGGISIHWHGLSQRSSPWCGAARRLTELPWRQAGRATGRRGRPARSGHDMGRSLPAARAPPRHCRYDGVSYVTQCPIAPGTNFTYTIPIDDAPGTYFWHEHSSLLRADGLQVRGCCCCCRREPWCAQRQQQASLGGPSAGASHGSPARRSRPPQRGRRAHRLRALPRPPQGALIVKPADGRQELGLQGSWDEERLMFLQDWFHGQAEALAMSLNRCARLLVPVVVEGNGAGLLLRGGDACGSAPLAAFASRRCWPSCVQRWAGPASTRRRRRRRRRPAGPLTPTSRATRRAPGAGWACRSRCSSTAAATLATAPSSVGAGAAGAAGARACCSPARASRVRSWPPGGGRGLQGQQPQQQGRHLHPGALRRQLDACSPPQAACPPRRAWLPTPRPATSPPTRCRPAGLWCSPGPAPPTRAAPTAT
jgi:hypothetical protein